MLFLAILTSQQLLISVTEKKIHHTFLYTLEPNTERLQHLMQTPLYWYFDNATEIL